MNPGIRMTVRSIALAVPTILLLTATPVSAAPPFSEELAVMQTTVDSFNACAERIEAATNPDDMASALSFAADELERVFPNMLSVSRNHPEWGRNPPPEVRPTMDSFDQAYDRFLVKALNKATRLANDNPDHAALQKTFGRVNSVLYHQR